MTEQPSLWQRMRSHFRAGPTDGGLAGEDSSGGGVGPGASPGASAPLSAVAERGGFSWFGRRRLRQLQVREASQRMVELAQALQDHFRRQDERGVALAGSLEHMGSVLEQLADSQRSQSDCLQTIAEQTESAGRHAAALSETLSRVPDSLFSQAEAIRTVARQLELTQESDTQLMHSLQQFGKAVDTLGSSGTAQVEALQRLNAAHREQQAVLTNLVREQGRRFLIVFVVGSILAVAALVALGVSLVLQLRT